jgi:Leucine-rich repeat (LRR) protein
MFSKTKRLQELVLSNNSLTVLAPGLLDSLEELELLDLSVNELTSQWVNRDTFSRLINLIILDLSFNALTKIDAYVFRGLYNLQILRLEHNNIDTLIDGCFASLTNLHTLTLSHNRIARFDPAHTTGLDAIRQLFLDSNKLRILHRHVFANFTNLQDLSLCTNSLTEVPYAVRLLSTLKTLDLNSSESSFRNFHIFLQVEPIPHALRKTR